MIDVKTDTRSSKRSLALLALCLFMLLWSLMSAFAPMGQVYAAEADKTQVFEQESSDANGIDETPGYRVYSYGYEGNEVSAAQINPSHSVIPDAAVPLAGPMSNSAQQGSYFTITMVLVCLTSLIAMFLAVKIRKTNDYRVIAARTIAGAFGLVTIAACFLLGTLNSWTSLSGGATYVISALFLLYVALAVGSFAYEAKLNREGRKSVIR